MSTRRSGARVAGAVWKCAEPPAEGVGWRPCSGPQVPAQPVRLSAGPSRSLQDDARGPGICLSLLGGLGAPGAAGPGPTLTPASLSPAVGFQALGGLQKPGIRDRGEASPKSRAHTPNHIRAQTIPSLSGLFPESQRPRGQNREVDSDVPLPCGALCQLFRNRNQEGETPVKVQTFYFEKDISP